jgi:predicted metal-dependent HD superfamily phosphohydrolase
VIEEFFTDLRQQLPTAPPVWNNVKRAYAGRAYHNLSHLNEMLMHLGGFRKQGIKPQDPLIFGIALVYHDIVYKPTRSNNEERSAQSATKLLRRNTGLSDERIHNCRRLILATKHHQLQEKDPPDTGLLIDLDLAVLARPAADYDRYAAAIRKEYWMVPGFVYRKERTRVLTALLDRPHIYQTEHGRSAYEAAARENLWRELRQLA